MNEANIDNKECPFLDLIHIDNSKVNTKMYNKNDFSSPTINYPFLDGVVPFGSIYSYL